MYQQALSSPDLVLTSQALSVSTVQWSSVHKQPEKALTKVCCNSKQHLVTQEPLQS
jgi:hypothetical protein